MSDQKLSERVRNYAFAIHPPISLANEVAALEAKLEAMEQKLQRVIRAGDELCKVTEDENVVDNWHEIIEWSDAAAS